MPLHEEAEDNGIPQAYGGSALQGSLSRCCALCSLTGCAVPCHMLQDGSDMLCPICWLAAQPSNLARLCAQTLAHLKVHGLSLQQMHEQIPLAYSILCLEGHHILLMAHMLVHKAWHTCSFVEAWNSCPAAYPTNGLQKSINAEFLCCQLEVHVHLRLGPSLVARSAFQGRCQVGAPVSSQEVAPTHL